MKYIKPTDIKENVVIIDLLSDESYEREHIKWAINFSVYEVAFPNKIQNVFLDKNTTLYIYGFSNDSKEAENAYTILEELWYQDIYIINDGLKNRKNLNLPVIERPHRVLLDWKYIVSIEKSTIDWTWRNMWRKHIGNLKLKNWYLLLDKWIVSDLILEIDMTSINNIDLKDSQQKNILVNHLKSKDFFEVDNFPISTLKIIKTDLLNNIESKPNYIIRAELTIKWITKDIMFDAHIHEKEGQIVINSHLDIDRSRWNIMYWSAKFFARLWRHMVDDIISIDMIIFAEKTG